MWLSVISALKGLINLNHYFNNMSNLKVIAVDIDGVLCKGECWTPEQCLKAKPILKNIEKVNELGKFNFIVIYTARRDFLVEASLKWLKINGVEFQAISNKKMSADSYIDDKILKL